MFLILWIAAVALAYANGANDNFKGVATLLGSRTTDYKRALVWACLTTLLGSIGSIWIAQNLLAVFSGKGLVPDALAVSDAFRTSVGLGATATILLATRLGLPVSTTHALTGALLGAGLAALAPVGWSHLGSFFVAPLLFSPLAAMGMALVIYLPSRALRLKAGIDKTACLCVGQSIVESRPVLARSELLLRPSLGLSAQMGPSEHCRQIYHGQFWGISVEKLMASLHYLSAGLVGFARGLNDTPKIAALLILAGGSGVIEKSLLIAVFIALGGWMSARRVAETMSFRITSLNSGQGLAANLSTCLLVVSASRYGLPVSTTHVSTGSLLGIGLISREADPRLIGSILLAWVGTLPLAAILSALCFAALG